MLFGKNREGDTAARKAASVMVFGAGISGRGVAGELAKAGRQVFLYDDAPRGPEPALAAMLARNGGGFVSGHPEELLPRCRSCRRHSPRASKSSAKWNWPGGIIPGT